MEKLTLYHTGFQEIREPDVHAGRRNADFGPGFYLSADREFSRRWARSRKGEQTWLNAYELDLDGLRVARLDRDAAWYDCIYRNRAGLGDALEAWDVAIGPIANDTIYDTWGIITSGLLPAGQALRLLQIGPAYIQVAVKTERAAKQLRFLSAEVISEDFIAACRAEVRREEEAFQRQFAGELERMGTE